MEMDKTLFDKLYRDNADRMYKIANAIIGNAEQSKDLVNDAFLNLLIKWDSLYTHPNLPAWLTVTVKNLAFDELKTGRRRYEMIVDDMSAIPVEDEPVTLDHILPKSMSPKERAILTMRYEQRLTCEEIAAELGISTSACKMRLARARESFRKNLEKDEIFL